MCGRASTRKKRSPFWETKPEALCFLLRFRSVVNSTPLCFVRNAKLNTAQDLRTVPIAM